MTDRVKVGSVVENFKLKDQDDKEFNLADFLGKKVLLSFHPLAWTPVCAEQMKSLEVNSDTFTRLNTIAVGLSIDSVFTKRAWAKDLGITQTRMLADFWPHGGVAQQLGIFRDKDGFSERANIVIDAEGKVALVKTYPIREVPDINEILEFIKGL